MIDRKRIKEVAEKHINNKNEYKICIYDFDLNKIVFEERVRAKCFHCKKYNKSFTCPPYIDHINFQKVFSEYDNCLVISVSFNSSDKIKYELIRKKSSNILHKILLEMEQFLWEHQYPLATCFIGGSCKLCKDGCAGDVCQNALMARIPWEATGVNVIKSVKNGCNQEIIFSNNKITRYGLLVW